jgi:hypothetical protein
VGNGAKSTSSQHHYNSSKGVTGNLSAANNTYNGIVDTNKDNHSFSILNPIDVKLEQTTARDTYNTARKGGRYAAKNTISPYTTHQNYEMQSTISKLDDI